jgi:glucosamine--fructose-6-phosphate aminotransferase (isomerizing)
MTVLKRLAHFTEPRGHHAFGFAWVDAAGVLKHYKQSGGIRANMKALEMVEGAVAVIGHCRWATHGDATNNLNNHPHPVDGGWLVHNGVISDYRAIAIEHNIPMVSSCDSEIIGGLIERASPARMIQRAKWAAERIGSAHTVLALWNRPMRLLAMKGGRPLHAGIVTKGIYLASGAEGLPGRVQDIDDDTVRLMRLKGTDVSRGKTPAVSLEINIEPFTHGGPVKREAKGYTYERKPQTTPTKYLGTGAVIGSGRIGRVNGRYLEPTQKQMPALVKQTQTDLFQGRVKFPSHKRHDY